jgi:NAD(P)H-dependent FMN reductase
MNRMKPRLNLIVCSTRPGRVGSAVGQWALEAAQQQGGFEPVLMELADFALPAYDEPEHPRLRKYQHAHTQAWSASVAAADAFVFVLPEYNHAPPGALINAMNYLFHEWQCKPAGLISYGGVSGGLRAAQTLKGMLVSLKVMPMLEAVSIQGVAQQMNAGRFFGTESQASAAKILLDELQRWTQALSTLRHPA